MIYDHGYDGNHKIGIIDQADKGIDIIQVCVRVRLSSVACNKAKVGAYATASPFSGDLLGDFRMSKLLDKSFIHRSYPKLACGSIYIDTEFKMKINHV